jgi:sugar phosphate isomerase/epimerase
MNRRTFLVGAASGVAAFTGVVNSQAPAPAAPATAQGQAQGRGGAGRGGGGGGAGSPAQVSAAKLARVSIMTLNFGSILKFPWTANPNANQTLDILDLPQMYRDSYGISNVEFQHGHLVNNPQGQQNMPDPAFLREMKAKLDAARVTASQINIEIGTIPNLQGEARATWLTRGKGWVDAAPLIGCKRLMLNQSGLNQENKANTIAIWKELQDYARPKGIMISAENRGGGGGGGGRGRGAADPNAPAPPPPPPPTPEQTATNVRNAWMLLKEVIEAAGAYSNVDIGNVGAQNQQQLHDCIQGLYATSSGNMHIKQSLLWDIGAAVRFTESLGYRGLYSSEVSGHPAGRQVYNVILANVTNPPAA